MLDIVNFPMIIKTIYIFWSLVFQNPVLTIRPTDDPYILEGLVLGPYKGGPYKMILCVF